MEQQLRLRLKILIGLLVVVVLSSLYFFLIKIGGFIFLLQGLIQLLISVCVTIWTVKLILRIVRNSEWRSLSNILTVLAIPAVVVVSRFDSLSVDENTFQSDVKIRACYEGTMNTSRLYLRENGKFEDFNIGFFAHVNYVSGTWKMDGDTILLNITSGQHNRLKSKMVIKDNSLYAVDKGIMEPASYYLGQCKGLN
jgi:hypothetical protein